MEEESLAQSSPPSNDIFREAMIGSYDPNLNAEAGESSEAAAGTVMVNEEADEDEMDVEYSMDLIETEPVLLSRPETPLSPRDIEITPQEVTPEGPLKNEGASDFPAGNGRELKLVLQKLCLSERCCSSDDRVDLGVLRLENPALFLVYESCNRGRGRPKVSITKKRASSPKKKPQEKGQGASVVRTSSSSSENKMFTSSDDSDSDLEQMRKKIMKSSLFKGHEKAEKQVKSKDEEVRRREVCLPKPCSVSLVRLSESQIRKWNRRRLSSGSASSRSSSRGRTMSRRRLSSSPSTRSSSSSIKYRSIAHSPDSRSSSGESVSKRKGVSPVVQSDSSDADEKQPEPKACKKLFVNPLFGAAKEQTKKEDVKQVLMEKLKTLIVPEESTEREGHSKSKMSSEKGLEEKKPSTYSCSTISSGNDLDREKKTSKEPFGPTFDPKLFQTSRRLRSLAELLKIEMGEGTLEFLGTKQMAWSEIELIAETLIGRLESNQKAPSKPKPAEVKLTKQQVEKYGLRPLSVTLLDAAKSKVMKPIIVEAEASLNRYRKSSARRKCDVLRSGLQSLHRKMDEERKFGRSTSDRVDGNQSRSHQADRPKERAAERPKHYDDINKLGSFKIPKRDGKEAPRDKDQKQGDRSMKSILETKKTMDTKTYNLQYNRKPGPKKGRGKLLFEEDLQKAIEPQQKSFNIRDVMTSMKKPTQKKPTSDEKDSALKKQKAGKQLEEKIDREIAALLQLEVKDKDGQQMTAVTMWKELTDGELLEVFRCCICDLIVKGGRVEIIGHVKTMRHGINMKKFTEVKEKPDVSRFISKPRLSRQKYRPHADSSPPRGSAPATPEDEPDSIGGFDDHDDFPAPPSPKEFNLPLPVPSLPKPVSATSVPNPALFYDPKPTATEDLVQENSWKVYDVPTSFLRTLSPVPVPPPPEAVVLPQPVPPPKPLASVKPSLCVSDLEKLPSPMGLEERVKRGLQAEDQGKVDERRGMMERRAGERKSRAKPISDEAYEPGGSTTPLWEPTPEEKDVRLPRPKCTTAGGFDINPTTSFMDVFGAENPARDLLPESSTPDRVSGAQATSGLKLKPMANLVASSTENPALSAGLSSFLDKVINGLKKTSKDPSSSPLPQPPLPPLPPDEDGVPPPLPPPDPVEGGVSPPRSDTGVNSTSFNEAVHIEDMDAVVLQIVSGLDKDLSDEEKLIRAKEKLSIILHNKARERAENERRRISDTEISSFMSQWCESDESSQSSQPAFSSALAKLRAKKRYNQMSQQPQQPQQQPLTLALKKLKRIPFQGGSPSPSGSREQQDASQGGTKRPYEGSDGWEGGKRLRNDLGPQLYERRPSLGDRSSLVSPSWDGKMSHAERTYSRNSLDQWKELINCKWGVAMSALDTEMEQRRRDSTATLSKKRVVDTKVVSVLTGEVGPLFRISYTEGSPNPSYWCVACKVKIMGDRNVDQHASGKKHSSNMSGFDVIDGPGSSQPAPPGEDAPTPINAAIQNLLDDFKEAPLLGIEYLVEILAAHKQDPMYKCMLCNTMLDAGSVISDLISAKHRLKYLNRYYPIASEKFQQVPNTQIWELSSFDFLEGVVRRIEEKNGRLRPYVVGSQNDFQQKHDAVKGDIELGQHFRQTSEQDFSSLPDPFSSYRHRLDQADIAIPLYESDQGLGHIEDLQMHSYMQREIAR